MNIYLIDAPIAISYGLKDECEDKYMREYHQLGQADNGEISRWLQSVKAKGEANESDPVLLNLMIELHRKIDNLEKIIKQEDEVRLSLPLSSDISKVGFEHFEFLKPQLEPTKIYYGRVDMPIYPKRDIGIFFEAVTPSLAHITTIHDRDQKAWNLYVRSRERVLIRETKEKKL